MRFTLAQLPDAVVHHIFVYSLPTALFSRSFCSLVSCDKTTYTNFSQRRDLIALLIAFLDGGQRPAGADVGRRSKRLCRSALQQLGEAVQRRHQRWDSLSIDLIAQRCGSSPSRLSTASLKKLLAAAVPVDIDKVGLASESTLLMECVKARTASATVILSCVRELVEGHGADVNQANQHGGGVSALIIAAARGFPGVVRYLVQKGADVSHRGTGRFVTYLGTHAKPVRGTMTALEWATAMLDAERELCVMDRNLQSLADCVAALRAAG